MTTFLALIDQLAPGIVAIIIGFILIFLYRFFALRQERRSRFFELEKELLRYRQANAITAVIVLIEIALIVWGIRQIVMPEINRQLALQGIQRDVQAQDDGEFIPPDVPPTASSLNIDPAPPIGEEESFGPRPTPTLTPTPVGTIIPAEPVVGCDTEQAQLEIPANGMRVFQPIPIVGTAFTDNFAYAKIEISGPAPIETFRVLQDIRVPIRDNSEFAQFVPAGYEPGEYQFRLMVFDVTNTLQAGCQVNIFISEPFPTATPIGQGQ